jgi:iron complex outermembrane receptor protein
MTSKTFAILLLATATQLPMAQAMAQDTGTTANVDPGAPAADDTADTTGIDDIIVTATRREESLQRVPVSVSAVTADSLEKAGIGNTRELTATMPGLNFSRVNSAMQPVIRGIGTRATGIGDESGNGVYIDGIYQADSNAAQIDLVNIERVEVLRGPQGTLFGRNSTGGVVNIITSKPQFETLGRVKLSYGRFDQREASGYVTTGLSDKVAIDLSAFYHRDDGFLYDIGMQKHVGGRKSHQFRSRLLITPTDALTITLTGSNAKIDESAMSYKQPFNGSDISRSLSRNPNTLIASEPWQVALSFPLTQRVNTNQVSAVISYAFDPFTIENSSSFQRTRVDLDLDQNSTPFDIGRTTQNNYGSNNFLNELRLISNGGGPLDYTAGIFFIDGYSKNPALFTAAPSTAVPNNLYARQDVRSVAGYGEVTWHFAEGWKLVAGGRYTTEHRDFVGNTTRGGVLLSQVDTDATFNRFTYRAILQKDVDGFGNFFLSYSTGFKSGVFNGFSTAATSKPVRPERVRSIEGGIKSDPLPWLRVNLSGFHYSYSDIQQTARDPDTALVILLNAARARLYGGELEITARPAPSLNLRAFGTLLNAKFTSFPGAQIFNPRFENQTAIGGSALTPIGNLAAIADVSGNRMIRAPKLTLGASVDYTKETSAGDFGIALNAYHSAKYYWDVANRLAQPGYVTLSGEISWTSPSDALRVSLWGKNLTNEVIYGSLTPTGNDDSAVFDKPRTFGVTAEFRF